MISGKCVVSKRNQNCAQYFVTKDTGINIKISTILRDLLFMFTVTAIMMIYFKVALAVFWAGISSFAGISSLEFLWV
jgi:hypothetical protein